MLEEGAGEDDEEEADRQDLEVVVSNEAEKCVPKGASWYGRR